MVVAHCMMIDVLWLLVSHSHVNINHNNTLYFTRIQYYIRRDYHQLFMASANIISH